MIADLSVNHVERQALLCGYTIERIAHDYGIDLELFTFNKKGEMEAGTILLQVKASDRLRLRLDHPDIPFRIERSDLSLWLAQPTPMILILYDAAKTVAYWLYIQSYFRSLEDFNLFAAGKTITVYLPTANVVDPGAMRQFARYRDQVLRQMRKVAHEEDENDLFR